MLIDHYIDVSPMSVISKFKEIYKQRYREVLIVKKYCLRLSGQLNEY